MNHDVYIAYNSKDKLFADGICAALETSSINCWIAPRDIQPGMVWAESITEAIRVSKVFILIFSKNASQAKDLSKELVLAMNMELTVLPVSIDDTIPSGMFQYYLSGSHWVLLTNPADEMQINKIVKHAEILIK